MKPALKFTVAVAALLLLATSIQLGIAVRAQTLPPAPRTPNLLGLYPGMPQAAARAELQKHSSTINVHTFTPASKGFELTNPDASVREQINVFLTQPPNDPNVWMIQRSQTFGGTNVMTQAALLAALREKYGNETFLNDKGGGGLYLFWIFDPSGRLLSSADRDLMNCTGASFVPLMMASGPPQAPTGQEQLCFKSFFAITAGLNRKDAQLLEGYNVTLVNLPYAFQAAMITQGVNNRDANQARQDQIKKGNENKPVF